MPKAYVLGISMTKFGRHPDTSIQEMGSMAVWDAVTDAGISIEEIGAVYCGHVFQGTGAGQKIMTAVGLTGLPIINLENACASGATAFREAYHSVLAGRYDVCLAVGVEKLSGIYRGGLADVKDLEGAQGLTFAALYALRARRYMHTHGLKPETLAKIAVKNRKNAYYNEKASYGELIDVDTVLNSRLVADPLHFYECTPPSDGAAAAIIVSEEYARKSSGKPVEIAASALTSGKLQFGFIDMTFEDITHRAAQDAYSQSGLGPEDVDFAEVHDCFTIAEILRVESLGFCPPGGMAAWIEEGVTEINGKKPVNPSGGLLGKGHPLGATGIAQIYEICKQLRGRTGDVQGRGDNRH